MLLLLLLLLLLLSSLFKQALLFQNRNLGPRLFLDLFYGKVQTGLIYFSSSILKALLTLRE